MNEPSKRLQFSLRNLLLLVLVISVLVAFPIIPVLLIFAGPLTGPVCALLILLAIRRGFQPRGDSGRVSMSAKFMSCAAFAPVLAALLIQLRWTELWNDNEWPRPFPYPDTALMAVHDWWDRLNPDPGGLKIHGEYFAVLLALNSLVFASWLLP